MKEGWIRGNSNKGIPARLTFTSKRTFDSVIDFIIIIVVAFVFFLLSLSDWLPMRRGRRRKGAW